jgi:hypothetical protein
VRLSAFHHWNKEWKVGLYLLIVLLGSAALVIVEGLFALHKGVSCYAITDEMDTETYPTCAPVLRCYLVFVYSSIVV